jgi:hypothetical protein
VATLQYDFSVVGLRVVYKALAGVERRFARSARAMVQMANKAGAKAAKAGAGTGKAATAKRMAAGKAVADAETQARLRGERKVRAQRERDAIRESNRRVRLAQNEAIAGARARERADRMARTTFRRNLIGGARQRVGRTLRGAGRIAGGALALGGGFAIASAIGTEKRARARAAALANQAFGTEGSGGLNRQQLMNRALEVARPLGVESGKGAEGVLDAMRQFQAIAGSFKGGTDLAKFMTSLADATDADLGDVGRTAGQVFQNVYNQLTSIEDPAERYAQTVLKTKSIMAVVAGQAKIGSIEMSDMAQQMGKLMSSTAAYKGDVADLANTMGAVGQLAIAGGAASPEEAMTALMRMSSDISQRGAGAFKKAGINVFADEAQTMLLDPAEIIMRTVTKTGGALPAMGKLLGIRSRKAFDPFRKAYVEAGGGAKGEGAMREMFERFKVQKMTEGEVTTSAAFRRAQDDKQFAIAVAKFNQAIGQQMLPAVTALIPEFVKLLPVLTKAAEGFAAFVKWFGENPLKKLGGLVLLAIVKDIAMAGIGAAVSSAITRAIAGGAMPGAIPGKGGPAVVPGAGPGASKIAAGTTAAAVAKTAAAGAAVLYGGSMMGGDIGEDAARAMGLKGKTGRYIGAALGLGYLGITGGAGLVGSLGRRQAESVMSGGKTDFWQSLNPFATEHERGAPTGQVAGEGRITPGYRGESGALKVQGGEELMGAGGLLKQSAAALEQAAGKLGSTGTGGQNRGDSPTVPR